VQPRRPSARVWLLALATALIATSVAASSAGAATFAGGPFKLDINGLKGVSTSTKGHSSKNTFQFADPAGTATMTKQASGSLNVGTATSQVTFKRGKKSFSIKSMVLKLTSGKAQVQGKLGGKGKLITLFDLASTNRVNPDSGFTTLTMSKSKATLTKAGAALFNSRLGLKGKSAYKAKQNAGSASATAERSLTVVGGQTDTVYDQAFVGELRKCDIELSAVAPATAIPKDPASAPEGGARLPVNAQNGGTLTATDLIGSVLHTGGTSLDRPAPGQPGNTTGKAEYHSPLSNFQFGFGGSVNTLTALVVNANNNLPIGTVTGTLVPNLTDTGGSVSITGGSLNLSDAASGTLSQSAPPLGADCPIPSGSKIGAINMVAQVE
jgi:hypothetical protein